MRRKGKQITDKRRKPNEITGLFFNFQVRMLGGAGQKISQKNIILIILDRVLILCPPLLLKRSPL